MRAYCTALGSIVVMWVSAFPANAQAEDEESIDIRSTLARTSEAKANLKAAYTAQRAYHQEKDTYTPFVSDSGFEPERGNRYSYYHAMTGEAQRRVSSRSSTPAKAVIIGLDEQKYPGERFIPRFQDTGCRLLELDDGRRPQVKVDVGVTGEFVIAAVGNIDSDPDLDCWSIASFSRRTKEGKVVPAGEPLHDKSDYDESAVQSQQNAERSMEKDIVLITTAIARAWKGGEMPTALAALPDEKLRSLMDAWGSPYLLIPARPTTLVLVSAGPDRTVGSSDDLALILTADSVGSFSR